MTINQWITEARGRCEAATKGPWNWDGDVCNKTFDYRDNNAPWLVSEAGAVVLGGDMFSDVPSDPQFIAAARTDLPKALEAIERLMRFVDHEDMLWGDPNNPAAQARADVERILTRAAKP